MYTKEELAGMIDASTTDLLNMLSSVDEKEFNQRINKNWSVADVAEHLLALETQINRYIVNAHTTERAADLKVEPVMQGLQSFENRYNAPDFTLPTPEDKDKNDLIKRLREQRDILKQVILTTDITETVDQKHPVIGSMTRLEWTCFNIHHTGRHMKQIGNILSSLKEKNIEAGTLNT